MKARLSDHVRLPNGEIATLASLVDAGRIKFTKSTVRPAYPERKAQYLYFAELVELADPDRGRRTGWEVHKSTYAAAQEA